MAQQETRDVIVSVNNGQALSSIKELEGASRRLRNEWRKTTSSQDRKKIASELKSVNTELAKMRAETRPAASGLQKVMKTLSSLGTLAIGMVGFQFLSEQFNNLIRRGAELSDSMADVQKTTGLTEEQVKSLDKSLRKIDTRSSRKELLSLARDAGKLGKNSVADVKKFVEQADKIKVALGEDLGEGALVTIGKLSNVFNADMLKIASSINEVGASSEASEPALVEFLSRLGGIAATANLSAPDIIGYGATLDALGLKAEMSTTALNTFFIDFIKNSEEMGQVAGFAAGELSNLIGTEGTNAGFVAFLEKLRETHPEQKQFLEALQQMGIDGARGSQVFLTLANNTDMLRKQQDIANDSFEKGSSVLDEFNVKNNNMAANLAKIQKSLGQFMLGGSFMGTLERWVSLLKDELAPAQETQIQQLSRVRNELNTEFEVLKRANFSQEERAKFIGKINTEYASYLPNLIDEHASLEEIERVQKRVNKQLLSRILYIRYEKEIAAIMDEQLQSIEGLAKAEEARTRALVDAGKLDGNATAIEQQQKNIELAAQLNEGMVANTDNRLQEVENRYARMAEMIGTTMGEIERMVSSGADDLGVDGEDGGSGGTSDAQKKKLKEAVDQTKKFIKELEDLKIAAIDNVEQREIAAAQTAYERRVEEINGSTASEQSKNDLIKQLTIDLENEKSRIIANAHQDRLEAEAERVAAANDSDLLTLQLKLDVTEEGSLEELDAVAELLQKKMEMEIADANLTAEQKLLIQQTYANNLEQLWEDYREGQREKGVEMQEWEVMNLQERMDLANEYISTYGNMMTDVMGMVFDYAAQNMDAEHEKFVAKQDKEKALLDQRLKSGQLSQAAYDQRMVQMAEERQKKEDALKRKQFRNEKAARITQAVINTALGVTSALATMPPASYIMAALTAALGASEIAMISSQPNPYYKGGYTSVTDTEGFKHRAQMIGSFSDGGYYSNASYGVVGERGTELVVPNHVLSNPSYADAVAQIEGAIYRRDSAQATVKPQNNGGLSSTSNSNQNDKLTQEMMELIRKNTAVMEKIQQDGVSGYWEYERWEKGVTDTERVQGRNILSSSNNRLPGERLG